MNHIAQHPGNSKSDPKYRGEVIVPTHDECYECGEVKPIDDLIEYKIKMRTYSITRRRCASLNCIEE